MISSKTKRSKQRDRSGEKDLKQRIAAFTLMEGLFGIAVMGIVFVSLYTGMTSGFQALATSQEDLRATQIMVDKFEGLRLYTWDQVTKPGFIPDTFTAPFYTNGRKQEQGIIYTGTISISPVTGQPYRADLRAVTITLSWKTHGRPRTQTFTSYIARYGLQNYIY